MFPFAVGRGGRRHFSQGAGGVVTDLMVAINI